MGNMGIGEVILLAIIISWFFGFYIIGKNKTLPIIEKVIWFAFNFFVPLIGLISYLIFSSKKIIKGKTVSS